jgi:hypothetical protein
VPDDRQAAPGDYFDASSHRVLTSVTFTTGGDAGTEANFRGPDRTGTGARSLGDVIATLNSSDQSVLPIVDPSTGRTIASLVKPAFLAGLMPGPRIGGMATPLGVYLTDGLESGGAGTLGLALTGVVFVLLGLISFGLVSHFFKPDFSGPLSKLHYTWAMSMAKPLQDAVSSILGLTLVFLALRCTPLVGTHAAEHQVVHCSEKGLPLTRETVRRMPRVHPRCGSNYAVGLTLFFSSFNLIFCAAQAQGVDSENAAMVAMIGAGTVALALWTRIGSLLQHFLLTKPASDAQIDNAIRAAEQLFSRQRKNASNTRPRYAIFRRIWSYGLIQVCMGYLLTILILLLVVGHRLPELKSLLEI